LSYHTREIDLRPIAITSVVTLPRGVKNGRTKRAY
jgi:hypothetical protein